MQRYIYQLSTWPMFNWDQEKIANQLANIHQRQGQLIGLMQALGFTIQKETVLQMLTLDVTQSSEIEGEMLNAYEVRSSIAKRLGIPLAQYVKSSRQVEGIVAMIMDATQNFDQPLTIERILQWQIDLLSGDINHIYTRIGGWRDDAHGPMQVVSGAISREKIHFEAPSANVLEKELQNFFVWIEQNNTDLVLKAAIAHLWFVTLHPFEDGNGRVARAISDYFLAKSEQSAQRFYSMSAQIRVERKGYYAILESTQKGDLNITKYLEWFLSCLLHAIENTEQTIKLVLFKKQFWEIHQSLDINIRQKLMLNKLLDGFKGKLTTSKWSKIAKCSQDTALRDIQQLIHQDILIKDQAGGRSTSYSLKI
ncbi:MAG: Fic family protein [Legionellales bacterium]|jgi:Fic family protein